MNTYLAAFQSSLLQAILGELPLSDGNITTHGRISYAAQTPWVFSGTIRDNILFGEEYDVDRYNEVIKACALRQVTCCFSCVLCRFEWGCRVMHGVYQH